MTEPEIRASDTDRELVVERLRRHYAAGRLDLPEYEERVAATYLARTWTDLNAQLADLPADQPVPAQQHEGGPDPCLLCVLLCVCPPAGVAYWLIHRRRDRVPA